MERKRQQLRLELKPEDFTVADDHYAIFHTEELVILVGVIPKVLLRASPREVSCLYGLAPVT